MTEHTDKAADKSGKAAPGKRGGSLRSPKGKRATAPGGSPKPDGERPETGTSGDAASGLSAGEPAVPATSSAPGAPGAKNPLAPDPATITFGSNKPAVAAPPKMPESSGLRFSGPSAGVLKSSGPQPTSPKASGLTFSTAKSGSTAKPGGKPAAAKAPPPAKPNAGKPAGDAAKSGDAKKQDAKKPETKPGATKPAIAPQASGRMFDKERSPAGAFIGVLVLLVLIGSGLSFWLKLSNETPPQEAAVTAPATETAVQEAPSDALAAVEDPAADPSAAPDGPADGPLSTAEIAEIQTLLTRLDLNPGSHDGVVTPATIAAIRSYEEMAGLRADGTPNRALLEELRSVADLYGG